MITSTGTYGCATQQEAIGIYDLVHDNTMSGAVKVGVISNLLNSKYRSYKKIISGLDLNTNS